MEKNSFAEPIVLTWMILSSVFAVSWLRNISRKITSRLFVHVVKTVLGKIVLLCVNTFHPNPFTLKLNHLNL